MTNELDLSLRDFWKSFNLWAMFEKECDGKGLSLRCWHSELIEASFDLHKQKLIMFHIVNLNPNLFVEL